MTDEELIAEVKETVKQEIEKGYIKEENTVVHLESILCVLSTEYAEILTNIAVNDMSGLDTYNFIKENDLYQKAVNANYIVYGEKEVKLSEINYLFVQTVKNYLLYHVMETIIGALMQMPKISSKLYEKMQILVAEQYVLVKETYAMVHDSKLGEISDLYNSCVEETMLKFPLDKSNVDLTDKNYTEEELILDARYAYIDSYILRKTPKLIYPIESSLDNLSDFGKYQAYTILNFSASLFLSEKYNLNILDLKEIIQEKR